MKPISEEEFKKHAPRRHKNDILLFLYNLKVGKSIELLRTDKWFDSPVNVYIGNILRATGRRFETHIKHDNSGWVIKRLK